jgi:hypothetical protein
MADNCQAKGQSGTLAWDKAQDGVALRSKKRVDSETDYLKLLPPKVLS